MKESPAALALWRQLLARALRSGVPLADAQDLASQAIVKALEAHDPARGPFPPFCRTIHANLLKNHWRDRKATVELVPDELDPLSPETPWTEFVAGEEVRMLRRIADQILDVLTSDEAALFLTLANVVQDLERVAVTEAAHRLGLESAKGWDIFRRIQRKARPYLADFRVAVEAPCAEAPEPQAEPFAGFLAEPAPPFDLKILLASACVAAGFEQALDRLGEETRARLTAALS